MRPLDHLRHALRQFRTQGLQSLLIIIAIALGTTVIALVGIVFDYTSRLEQQLGQARVNRELLLMQRRGGGSADVFELTPDGQALTLSAETLQEARPLLPSVDYGFLSLPLRFENPEDSSRFAFALAVTEEYLEFHEVNVLAGSRIIASDFREGRPLMLASRAFTERLNLPRDPIGSEVTDAAGGRYTIIGLIPEPQNSTEFPALVVYAGQTGWLQLTFAVQDYEGLRSAHAELSAYARSRWGEGVQVSAPGLMRLEGSDFTLIMVAVFASLGLLVAALNIMNLTLARVLRRYREIGVRRSLGASRGEIQRQFLSESLLLGLLGGTLGIVGGYGIVALLIRAYPMGGGVGLNLPWQVILLGLGLSGGISLLFGLYPALVASRIRIVESLRTH